MLLLLNMSNSVERNLSVTEELGTGIFRGLHTGSGVGRLKEQPLRQNLEYHLGLDRKSTASPEVTILGVLLIGYVTTTTRLIAILEGKDPDVIRNQVLEHLQLKPDESPQETFERLLTVAQENSQKINS